MANPFTVFIKHNITSHTRNRLLRLKFSESLPVEFSWKVIELKFVFEVASSLDRGEPGPGGVGCFVEDGCDGDLSLETRGNVDLIHRHQWLKSPA